MNLILRNILKYGIVYTIGTVIGFVSKPVIDKHILKKKVKEVNLDENVGTIMVSDGDYTEQNGEICTRLDIIFVPNESTYDKIINKTLENGSINANVNVKYVKNFNNKVRDVDTDKVA